jgi:hypothetical protein
LLRRVPTIIINPPSLSLNSATPSPVSGFAPPP